MYFRQIYIFILAVSIFTIGCQKLVTDPGGSEPIIAEDNGIKYWGGGYNDFGHGVYETADGGYAVVGSQYSTSTQEDLLLVKFDSGLEFESNATYSGQGLDSLYNNSANDVQQTADGGYVLVGKTFNGSNYDVLIVKFSPQLTLTWQDTIDGGGSDDVGNSIRQRQDGGFVICGNSYDGNDEDIMLWGITVSGTTPAHSVLYNSEPTGSDNGTRDFGNHAEQTYDGGYIIVGTSAAGIKLIKLKSDKTPDTDWGNSATTDGFAALGAAGDEGTYIQQTDDGSYIVLGNTEGDAGLQSQVYLNTVSSTGVSVLSRTMGGSYDDAAESIIQTGDGGFIFTGYQYNENTGKDIWIVKLTPTLTTHWDKIYGGSYNDSGASIKETFDDGFIVTGSTMSYGNQSEIILLEVERDGCIWSDDHGTKISCGL